MANYELFPTQNLNCEVTTSDVSFDLGDTSRFRKIEFPEQAGITANALLQLVPAQLAADTASNLYVIRFPKGIQGDFNEPPSGRSVHHNDRRSRQFCRKCISV